MSAEAPELVSPINTESGSLEEKQGKGYISEEKGDRWALRGWHYPSSKIPGHLLSSRRFMHFYSEINKVFFGWGADVDFWEDMKHWPQEVHVYYWKWVLMTIFSVATMVLSYAFTGNGTFTAQVVYTTNFLQGGVGTHVTTTVSPFAVSIGWIVGSEWAIPSLIGLLLLLWPRVFFRYMMEYVVYRNDILFHIVWLQMIFLQSFVIMSLIGWSDVFGCLFTAAFFAGTYWYFQVQPGWEAMNAYKTIGLSHQRTTDPYDVEPRVEGDQQLVIPGEGPEQKRTIFVIASGHPSFHMDPTKRDQLVGAADWSEEWMAFALGDTIMRRAFNEEWGLYHVHKHPRASDTEDYLVSREHLNNDLYHMVFAPLFRNISGIGCFVFATITYWAFWIQNEHAVNGSYNGYVYPIYWIFWMYMLIHSVYSGLVYSRWNRESFNQETNDPVRLLVRPWMSSTFANVASFVIFQLITWFALAGLRNVGILYYSL